MFYSQFILAKKGPLGTIWIAAHLERKLRKNQVADTDIGVSVDSIIFPEVPIALRLSSHLLLGVVRIYSRKVNYLFDDCSEALLKIKQAFRSTAVDLPPEESTAPYHSITLPETFDLDDFELPDTDIFQGNYVDHHVSTREQITLQDTMDGVVYSSSQFGLDERFGDGDTSQVGLDLEEDLFLDKVVATGHGEISENNALTPVEPISHPKMDTSHEGMAGSLSELPLNGTRKKIEGLAANLEGIDYAQAPSTPGLMEEPNLFGIKEGLVSEDHLESEDQNLREFVQIGGSENASSNLDLHHRDDATDFSVGVHLNSDSIVCMRGENGSHPSRELDINQTRVGGDSLSTEATTGPDPVDGTTSVLDGLNKVEDVNKVASCDNEESVPSIDRINGECDRNKLRVRLQETNDVKLTKNTEEALSNSKPIVSNTIQSVDSPSAPNSVNVVSQGCQGREDPEVLNDNVNDEPMETACIGVLQTCNSHLSDPDMLSHDVGNYVVASDLQSADIVPLSTELSQKEEGFHASGISTEVQGQECHKSDVGLSKENPILEATLSGEILADGGKQEVQLDKAISNDNQCEDLNSSMTSDLPAPEKLLFAPHRLLDRPHDLLVETPDKQVLAEGDESGAGTQISGKKRSFAESSLTVQSINSVESFGMAKSKRTVDDIPDDDDLLSSILVGRRSSVLKMKPTPQVSEVPSMKRARFSSRPTTMKRKVLMDDSMVLHGDTIRQQLTNTEDIRRVRKKAPCTRTEILMIQRQFLEEEIFSEPVITGMLAELSCLHSEAFDLSRIVVSENDDKNNATCEALNDEHSARQNVAQHSEIERSTEPVSCRNDLDRQSSETPTQNDTHQVEDHFGSYDIGNQGHVNGIIDSADYRTSEHEHLGKISDINKVDAEVADAANHSAQGFMTSQKEPVSGDIFEMTTGTVDQSDVMDKMIGSDDFMQIDASDLPSDKIDTQEEVASLHDMTNGRGLDGIEFEDHSMEQLVPIGTELRTEGMSLEESKAGAPIEIRDFHLEGSAPIDDNFSSAKVDQTMDVIENDKHVIHCEVGGLVVSSGCIDDKDQISNHICDEESKMDSTYLVGHDGHFKSTSMNGDYTVCEQADQSIMDTRNTQLDHVTIGDCSDLRDDAFVNDTEFLNVDDDEVGEDYEDGMPNAEDTRVLDNSGWSSRTRAVAKYLQTLFDKEAGRGRKVLPMDSLLAGKTRKEASRMFFETLVLKTRDYVHVEQAKPFDNISIKPRSKLMKSDF